MSPPRVAIEVAKARSREEGVKQFFAIRHDLGHARGTRIVNDTIIVEVKATETVTAVHFAQVLTYLKASNLKIGLLMNFNAVHLKDGLHRIVNGY